jgi:cytoskeletal protein RodZ
MANNNSNSEERFDDMPLPDMEASWQNMKVRLDKRDQDRKPFILLSRRKWTLVAMVLISAALIIWFAAGRMDKQNITATKQLSQSPREQSNHDNTPTQSDTKTLDLLEHDEKKSDAGSDNPNNQSQKTTTETTSNDKEQTISKAATAATSNRSTGMSEKALTLERRSSQKLSEKNNNNNRRKSATTKEVIKSNNATNKSELVQSRQTTEDTTMVVNSNTNATDIGNQHRLQELRIDTINASQDIVVADSSSKPGLDVQTDNELLKTNRKRRNLVLSAGIGLQQPIAIGGQKAISYSYHGRKSILADYTPSIYFRLEKDRKWFIQAEYKYSAGQPIEEFSYSRKTRLADTGKVLSTTHHYLKKTYYHQLPISFNYFIVPRLSVGTGVIYNRFQGAVTERQITTKNINSQQESISREILNIKRFNDSFLFKTQLQLLLQAEYQWKRFSFGLRYTHDLQPYIKYTNPEGEVLSRKNNTLQALIRFRIWQKLR